MKSSTSTCSRRLISSFIVPTSNSVSSSLLNFHFHSDFTDHQNLQRILEFCRLSLNSRATFETHARIIKLGYETYPSIVAQLLSTYKHCACLNHASLLLDRLLSLNLDLITMNLCVESLMRIGECKYAQKLFDKMLDRDVVTWNSILGGYVKNSLYEDALSFFNKMLSSNIDPDGFTFASVLSACARLGALTQAQWVHGLMIEKKIELNSILSCALIDMYSKCSRIQTAKEVFDSVPRNDVSVWNGMINGLAIHGLGLESIKVFSRMEAEKILPDFITFLGILNACSHCGLVEEGRKYFDLMRNRYLIKPQLEHYGAMVDLLGRAGLLEEAYAMIKEMPMEPDVVIWRALLSASKIYRRQDMGEVAMANMTCLKSGDYVLLSNIYCSLERWDNAERVRQAMKKKGIHKRQGKSWIEYGGAVHNFKAGDQSHPEKEAIYRVLKGLVKRAREEGYMPMTELVLMDVSDEEKEVNLNLHSEKLALAYGILKTSPGTEVRISKNLRICHDCHSWMKIVSMVLRRVVIVRDQIRFHRFEDGLCSCRDFW